MKRSFKRFAQTSALCATMGLCHQQAHAKVLFEETFDTDAADTAAFETAYSDFSTNSDGVHTVTASGGQAVITQTQEVNTFMTVTVTGFGGDVTYSVDIGADDNNGAYNIGLQIGPNRIVFHPGFAGGALRVEGPNGFGNQDMGFTPANGTLHHLSVKQNAATGLFEITLTDGDVPANVYNTSFTNLAAVGGDFGITRAGPKMNATGIYDNLKAEDDEPEDLLNLAISADGSDLDFSWNSRAGKVYDLLSSIDPETDGDPGTWSVVTGQEGIAAIPPSNTVTITRPADAVRLYVVRERDAPPLFSDDFETVQNWTTGANTGDTGNTVWERGAPVANLGGGATGPATGANGSTNCYGTNIAAIYGSDTDIYLRSPEINLTNVGGGNTVTLALQYLIDTDLAAINPDRGSIRVLNANNLSEQLGADLTGNDGLGGLGSDGWMPFSEPLPAEALGKTVVIEFQFTSNDDTQNFGGFYIDEVTVTVN